MEVSESESLPSSYSIDPAFINRILSKKCPFHTKEKSDLLHLTPTSKCSRICSTCKNQRQIPDDEIISILEIMQAPRDNRYSLPMIPKISEDKISQQIEYMEGSIEPLEKKIELFYDQLIMAVEISINEAREKTKRNLTESVNYYIRNVESVKQTDLIEQFQGILLSTSNDEDEQINELFQKACNNSKINIAMINNNLNAFNSMKEQFTLGQSRDIQERIEKFIRDLDQFPQMSVVPTNNSLQNNNNNTNNKFVKIDLLEFINVLPYTPRSSQSLQIAREFPQQTLLITNKNEVYSESFLNHQLEKTQKYILRIQLIHNCLNNQPFFTILLLNSLQEKFKFLFLSNLSYCEIYGGHMTNVLRGQQLWSGNKNIGQGKMIEFRIQLDKKIMRAASYPDYKNVVELYDPSSIDENGQYYIAFNITYPTDSIRIVEFKTVTQFDSSMD